VIPKVEFTGRTMSLPRPVTSAQLRRAETEYARQRKQVDSNPRYRYDNIVNMDLDMPEKSTQDFEGPGMASKVDGILHMNLHGDDGNDVVFAGIEVSNGLSNPYMHYPGDQPASAVNGVAADAKGDRAKSGKKKSSSGGSSAAAASAGASSAGASGTSRPKSAARR